MAVYPVRCRNGSCRHRRKSRIHPDDYKLVPICGVCGKREGWRIEHQGADNRELCDCGGVMGRVRSIRHKKSHPFCLERPDGPRNQLLSRGYKESELFDLLPLDLLGKPVDPNEPLDACPF